MTLAPTCFGSCRNHQQGVNMKIRKRNVLVVKLKPSALTTKPPLDMILRKFQPPLIHTTYLATVAFNVILPAPARVTVVINLI
jgi:hypothetical protein